MRQSGQPLGWFLSEVWDRWRDRTFWASQQALRHVQAESDVVLYLVNAAESPQAAGYVAPEMDLLAWVGKPVLVLLNQLGAPRAAREEAAEVEAWRAHLARWPLVRGGAAAGRLRALLGARGHAAARRAGRAAGRARRAPMARLTAAWRGAPAGRPSTPRCRCWPPAWRALAAAREVVAEARGLARAAAPDRRRRGTAARRRCRGRPGRRGAAAPGRSAGRRGARQHHAADRTARAGGPRAGRDPAARGRPVRSATQRVPEGKAAHPRRRRHRRAGRAEGRHRQRRAHARRRPARRRPDRRPGRGRAGARHQRRARHRPQLGGLERRGDGRRWSRPRCCATWRWRTSAAAAANGCRARRRRTGRRRWPTALAPQREALAALWAGRSDSLENVGEAERLAAALQPLLASATRAALARLYPGAQDPPP